MNKDQVLEELYEFAERCAEDGFCTSDDAYAMQQGAIQVLMRVGSLKSIMERGDRE